VGGGNGGCARVGTRGDAGVTATNPHPGRCGGASMPCVARVWHMHCLNGEAKLPSAAVRPSPGSEDRPFDSGCSDRRGGAGKSSPRNGATKDVACDVLWPAGAMSRCNRLGELGRRMQPRGDTMGAQRTRLCPSCECVGSELPGTHGERRGERGMRSLCWSDEGRRAFDSRCRRDHGEHGERRLWQEHTASVWS